VLTVLVVMLKIPLAQIDTIKPTNSFLFSFPPLHYDHHSKQAVAIYLVAFIGLRWIPSI